VIVVSDEPEQSGDTTRHLERIFAGAGGEENVVVSGVVASSCGDDTGYGGVISRTDGLKIDICDESWDDPVDELALRSLGAANHVVLESSPIPWTVEVTIDGVVTSDWRLDRDVVYLMRPMAGGELISVRYTPWAECT
jgi:hypothetical protein